MSWENLGTPDELRKLWEQMYGPNFPVSPPVVFRNEALQAFVGREPIGHDRKGGEDLRWHISVQGPGRTPTWDELVETLHALRPGVTFVIGIPPRSFWINVHEHVLHAWQMVDPNLEEQWRLERLGQTPT